MKLLSLLLMGAASPAQAQAQAQLSNDIIVVTGRLPDPLSERSEAIIAVMPDAPRLENALRDVAGLQQFRRSDARSANPTSQGVTLRGLGGNASSRAVLILDDVPQADPFGGWVSWPGYDALNLASVRVRKGAGLVSAGPGALAGVIELDSLQIGDQIDGSIAYGSRSSVDAKAALVKPLGRGSISLSGSYARGDGFIPIIDGQRGSVDRGARYEHAGIALRGVASISATTELQANVRAYNDVRDRGFDFSDNRNSGVDASVRLVRRDREGWQWSALGYVQLRNFANRFGSVAGDRNSVSLVLDQVKVPATGLGARIELRPPIGDGVELRVGSDWRRTIGETQEDFFFTGLTPGRNRNAGGRTDTLGAFADASWQASDALTLSAAGRIDRWNIADGFRREINLSNGSVRSNDIFADRSGNEWTARGGFAFAATPALQFRGAAYRAWRLPTLNELYRPFRVGADATAANELLAPERLTGAEIGTDVEAGALRIAATVFANRLDNAIANVTLANGPGNFPGVGFVAGGGSYSQRRNLRAISSKGAELEAGYRIGDFSLRASYAYVDARVRNPGVLDGQRPAQVPQHFASGAMEYGAGPFKLNAAVRYIGSQNEDDLGQQILGQAFTVDGGVSLALKDGWQLQLRAENLFDAQVDAAISNSGVIERATPRTIWLGVSARFD
ncbi:MAG: TonB-dependent receptor [Parasphingorhabdus sp.]|nr:TonB-dependent receptor [Parasphingorhabdus sp.]